MLSVLIRVNIRLLSVSYCLTYFFFMNRICHPRSCERPVGDRLTPPTILLSLDSEGNKSMLVVEQHEDPSTSLDFSDFALSECLRHGVSYHALQVSPDIRMGSDASIEAFNNSEARDST